MNRLFFRVIALSSLALAMSCSTYSESTAHVGFVSLLAKPKSYDGMELVVDGFLIRDRQSNLRLWLSQEIANSNRVMESVLVSEDTRDLTQCIGHTVRIIGNFSAANVPANSEFDSIRVVSRSEIRDGREHDVRCDTKS